MNNVLEDSLFVSQNRKFDEIQSIVRQFSAEYVGNSVIKDNIFAVIQNYARKKEIALELLRYPIHDDELWALTFLKQDTIFVCVNTALPLCKQFFAAAHELYHIYCYVENADQSYIKNGSMLDSATGDETGRTQEDLEANAFAGLLLMPDQLLHEQILLYGLDKDLVTVDSVLMLMDMFAMPYKAVVLRLFESGNISHQQAEKLLKVGSADVMKRVSLTGKAKRWQLDGKGTESFGTLLEKVEYNRQHEYALEIRTIKNNPWTGESVKNILRNEKYCGDVLMQKTYTVDCLTHKTKKNEGEVEQYFIPDHHPAIVEREVWDKAQVRLEQIAGKRRCIRPKQQRLIPLRKGVLLGFVPIKPTWKAVSFKRLETATEKVMALVDAKPEQEHIEYESEECEMEILKGFEVINLKQPKGESVMTVTSNSLKFNKATAVELNYAPYIRVLLNAKTRQIAIQPCSEKDPNAIKFSNEESKQTYAISIKVPAIQVEFRRMLPFEDDNGGKLSYTLNGTLYPDEQVVIYDIGDVKPETEKKRRGRRKKSEIEAEQKEN